MGAAGRLENGEEKVGMISHMFSGSKRYIGFVVFLSIAALSSACSTEATAKGKKAGKNTKVLIQTSMGDIKIELFDEEAPVTTKNFLDYVKSGFYTDVIFHRVISGFMIQGGGFDANLQKKPVNPPIINEASNGIKNTKGTLSMARTMDPNSATSQFFINVVDNVNLDPNPRSAGYAVFAKVIEGMEVVDAIAEVTTLCPSRSRMPCNQSLPKGMRDVPAEPVVIKKMKKVRK